LAVTQTDIAIQNPSNQTITFPASSGVTIGVNGRGAYSLKLKLKQGNHFPFLEASTSLAITKTTIWHTIAIILT
jgi:hypothetical protein